MNTEIHTEPAAHPFTDAAKEIAGRASTAAREAFDATKDAAENFTDKAKDMCGVASLKTKAHEALATSKHYVRRNPVTVVLGAVSVGAVIGYMVMSSRRKHGFGERYVDEPISAVREAILSAFAPVAQRVHNGYDSAREGAGKAIDRLHRYSPGCHGRSLSKRVCSIGNNLKFW